MNDLSIRLSNAVITLFQLTNMNVFALNQYGETITLHAPHEIPDTMNQQAFQVLAKAAHENQGSCHFWRNGVLTYMAGAYGPSTVIVAGPFLTQMPDFIQLNEQVIRSLPILNHSSQQSAASVLSHLHLIESVSISYINEQPVQQNSAYENLNNEANAALINLRYSINNDMMHAIETGNELALRDILTKAGNLFDFTSRFPNKPLRAIKNNLIILNTTFRLAAERGGVPPVFLHQLSEKFAIDIERINSLHSLDRLSTEMGNEYCRLVKNNKLNGFSPLIQQALRHFHVHFIEHFDAAALAESLNVHPSHLARQFKKETGVTMVQFVQNLRISEAKRLLKKDRSSIDFIAGQCGFEDAAYFARVFKKVTGVSPGAWRAQ